MRKTGEGKRQYLSTEMVDEMTGKLRDYSDPRRRASKRQTDLADIARLIESRPELRYRVPKEILARIEQ